MADLVNYPRQDKFETTLAQDLNNSDTTLYLSAAPSFSLSSGQKCELIIDYDSGTSYERCTINGPYTGGTTIITGVTRGNPKYSGGASTAKEHSGGAKVIIGPTYVDFENAAAAINSKFDKSGGVISGSVTINGGLTVNSTSNAFSVPSITTAQRLALSPTNGMIVYDTDLGLFYKYEAGSWSSFASGSVPNAAHNTAGKVDIANTTEMQNGTATDAVSGAPNVVPVSQTVVNSSGAGDYGKVPVLGSDGKLATGFQTIYNNIGFGEDTVYVNGVLGENFSASDITNNLVLAYRKPSDQKWYKCYNTIGQDQYGTLGIVLESGNTNDTKKIMLKGVLKNQSFSNINPTFSQTGAGFGFAVGQNSGAYLCALQLSNSGNGECVITGGTVRAKRVGSPAGDLSVSLVLENNSEQSGQKPACYGNAAGATNHPIGAVLGSSSIPSGSFTTSFQDLPVTFSNVKIPAGCRFYLVFQMLANVDASNYYGVENGANGGLGADINGSWGGSAAVQGYYTLNTSSTSPVGYAVKVGSNQGEMKISCTTTNLFPRVIGRVLSATSMYFDPEHKETHLAQFIETQTTSAPFYKRITTNFCPSELRATIARSLNASTPVYGLHFGSIRGDKSLALSSGGITGTNGNFLQATSADSTTENYLPIGNSQNYLHAMRLEDGYYCYCGYPGGTNNVNQLAAGYSSQGVNLDILAIQ